MIKLDGVREKVFLDRYSLKDKKGQPLEKDPSEMWRRVARGIASVEKKTKRKYWEDKFVSAMEDFKFVPGGRVLAGAGTGYEVTFYNCFVIPSPPDSRDGILENLKQMVEIMARGGGVGINLSSLRPKGSRVKKVNGFSSGPCNWAELYSLATKDIIQQGGCFTGETRIATHLGLIKIEDIVSSKRNLFASTHEGFKRITAKFDNGVKETFEVETEGGYKVRTTVEHKFLTFNKNGVFFLEKLSNLNVGDQVVLLPVELSNDIPEVLLNTDIPAPSKFSYGRVKVNLSKTLTSELAFILGVYMADGSRVKDEYSFAKGIRFAVDAKRTKDLNLLVKTLNKIFGLKPIVRKGDGAVLDVSIYSRNLVEFLSINKFLKENSTKVFVPEQVFSSPRRVVEAFIAGVFFGDGGNRGGKGGFRIASVNRRFLEDIQTLLINLNVASKIRVEKRVLPWHDLYTLSINGNRFMARFFDIVRNYSEKAYDLRISKRDGFYNFPINVLSRFSYLSGIQRTIAYTNPTTSYKTFEFIDTSFSKLREEDIDDAEILTSTITDRIKVIKELGAERVYDLEVEDVHLLSGNGFYTSNSRRGALMLMLWDWHPDIEEFITVKQDLSRINGANLSVCVSDSFMEAVKKDGDWDLIFPDLDDPKYDKKWDGIMAHWKKEGGKVKVHKTVKARHIWNLIAEAAWRSAEPGVVFMERYNKWYNNWYWNTINCVNPCGEEGLPNYGVCNLASLNLSAFVKGYEVDKPGVFDYDSLAEHARIAVRFQDDVVDADQYIYPEIEKMQHQGERRIGLGTLGLADALIKMHIRYGSDEAVPVVDKIYRTIRDAAYDESVNIAREKGSFPKINIPKHLKGYFIKQLPLSIRKKMKKYGIRNSMLLQAAPTGTTSLLSGASSGVEPVYEFEYTHNGRLGKQLVYHNLYGEWKKAHPNEERPSYFVSANDLTPEDHVKMQAIVQKYVDASISKTVNAPNSHTVEDVKKLYTLAYEMGCKGITYMRDGSRLGVLQRVEEKKDSSADLGEEKKSIQAPVMPRPMMVEGVTYQTDTPVGKTFITINHNENGEPFEVFITIGKVGSDVAAMADSLGRMISLNFRINGPLPSRERIRQVISQLIGIGGAKSVGFGENRVRSLPDAVAKILAKHYNFRVNGSVEDKMINSLPKDVQTVPAEQTNGHSVQNGSVNGNNGHSQSETKEPEAVTKIEQLSLQGASTGLFDLCPECGSGTLAYEEGCKKCYSCGYSEC